ncbi:MAG: DUF4232 domain-containing protein [Labilithrix sp.]|nr:DUF4232 domain-containing protein [Labilithrix sp.]
MTTSWACTLGVWTAVVLAGAGGCAPPAQRKPIEMTPIGTVPNVPRTADDDTSEGPVTSPNSGTPSPGTAAKEAACTGGEFDALDDALRQCDTPMPRSGEVPGGMKVKLDVRVVPSTPSTTPGGRVDLVVTLKNKSSEPLPLYFSGDPSPRFEVEALDAKGRRADLPTGKPPKAGPTREVKASRITLTPGGTAKVRLAWDAVKTRWAPEKAKTWEGRGPPRAPAGPLPTGKYQLRVVLPLIGVFEKGELDLPKVPMEVGGS